MQSNDKTNTNQKKKKIPERSCLGCGEAKPKNELIRVVRTPEDGVQLDFTGKKSGRGAYICKNLQCFKKAVKAKRLERNLGCEIPESVFDALESELAKHESG